jgi:hypothetical protein
LAATAGTGGIRLLPLVGGLFRHPGDIAALMRLAGRYLAARQALAAIARTGCLAPLAFAAAPTRIL